MSILATPRARARTSVHSLPHIGNAGIPVESGTIRVGTTGVHTKTFIAGISVATVPTGLAVMVEANGHLSTVNSSARLKEEIKPMDKASEAILALEPVTFHYKHDLDPEGIPQFGPRGWVSRSVPPIRV